MKGKDLESWWVLERDPEKGGYGIHPLSEVLERNMRQCVTGSGGGRVLLGLFPTAEAAQEGRRQVKRRREAWAESQAANKEAENDGGERG